MIAVREFTTAAEVFANAKAVRAKFFSVKPNRNFEDETSAKVLAPEPRCVRLWEVEPLLFDSHVTAYRVAMRVRAMVEAGEIELLDSERKPIHEIVREVLADFPQYCIADLKSPRRNDNLVAVRHLAIYEVRKQRPDMSLPAIGRWFGGRDHTTVLHSIRKLESISGNKLPVLKPSERVRNKPITPDQRAVASRMWRQGFSSVEIAKEIGIDEKRISCIAFHDRANFPERGKGFNWKGKA